MHTPTSRTPPPGGMRVPLSPVRGHGGGGDGGSPGDSPGLTQKIERCIYGGNGAHEVTREVKVCLDAKSIRRHPPQPRNWASKA